MGAVILHVTMSLDGFIAGPDVGVDNPMGVGGLRLHEWLFNADANETDSTIFKQHFATVGAVVLGRRTFDVGVDIWKDTPYPAPSFVVTHRGRDDLPMNSSTFTFVTEGVESAIHQAKAAAGTKHVTLMGADVAQQAIRAGLLDEIHLQLAPVLLGTGRRLFDHLGTDHIELERTSVTESPHVTHLRFRLR
jgi:dihydrofolate reductase